MSIEAIKWALNLVHDNPTHKAVLFGLANHADPDGMNCHPSIPRLEIYTALHRATIIRCIQQMEVLGILSAHRVQGVRTRYTLNLSFGPQPEKPVAQSDPSHSATGSTGRPPPVAQGDQTRRTGRPEPSLTIHKPSKSLCAGPESFDEFYAVYPLKKGKDAARKAYLSALKRTDHATILAGAVRYAVAKAGADRKYIKHPSTWLNAGCWDDEDEPPPGTRPSQGMGRHFDFMNDPTTR